MAVRRILANSLLIVATCAIFVSAWPIRDHELMVRVSNILEDSPVEMYDENPLCTVLPDCFRISHKLIVGSAAVIIPPIAKSLNQFVGSTVTDSPSWAPRVARNIGPYLILRFLFVVGFIYVMYLYLKKLWLVGVIGNLLLIWWSGLPVRAFTSLYEWFLGVFGIAEFHHDLLTWHISRNSTIFILEYDLLALLATLTMPLLLVNRVFHQRLLVHVATGLILAITFENLAIVYVVSMLGGEWILRKQLPVRDAIAVTIGWSIPIASLVLYARLSTSTVFPVVCPDDGSSCLSIPELGRSMNRSFRPLIYRLVVGFLVLPFAIGWVVGAILKFFNVLLKWSRDLRVFMAATIGGLSLTYLVGYFGSALPTEFGRQSLSGQILMVLYGVSIGQLVRTSKESTKNA